MVRELSSIAEDLRAGRHVEPVTVRTFLGWFEARRRGFHIVREIRRQLAEAGVITVPDFESRWVDAPIAFELTPSGDLPRESVTAVTGIADVSTADDGSPAISWVTRDATYRISKLAAANQGITSVPPDATLAHAVTLLLGRDFSQLAVMTSEREVKGIISWKSIGSRLALGRTGSAVRDFMDEHQEVKADVSIFDAIPLIRAHEYVLVRGEASKITGIVTGSDLLTSR
jgi:CBS domain-containing protein